MSALSSSSMVDTNAVAMHACKNDGFGASGKRGESEEKRQCGHELGAARGRGDLSDGRRRRSFFFTMREGTSDAVREGGRVGKTSKGII